MEQAWCWLQAHDLEQAMGLWMAVAEAVEGRSEAYLKRYGCTGMRVGAACSTEIVSCVGQGLKVY